MALSAGTKLGPYEIIAPLGAGGMGEVYRAKDTRLGRDVAIKILPKELSADTARKLRFEREAKAISGLNHPNICTLHDVGSQDGVDYLVMECVEGETLAAKLQKGPMPLEHVMRYGAQIADALDKAHRAGIVHRDLKPGNVMLTASGAKLLDFGLAKPAPTQISGLTVTSALPANPVTQEGTIVGTFQYMSPEQVEGKEIDGRSDIFSLGAVLYEMLTGMRAFAGKSQLSVASAILEKDPQPLSALKPSSPAALDHAIRKCLAKEPDARWQSASDLAGQLSWIAEFQTQKEAAARPAVASSKMFRAGWLVSAGLLLLLGGAAAAWWSEARQAGHTMYFSSAVKAVANDVALSPDGKTVAMVAYWDQGNKYMIWTYAIGDRSAAVVQGTGDASHPFWSPDGQWIGFFAYGKLKKVDILGRSAEVIADAPNGRGGTWNKEGVIVFTPDVLTGLHRVSASGGPVTEITKLDSSRPESSHRWPTFLPDGRHFLYLSANFSGHFDKNAIFLGSLDSNEKRLIVNASSNAVYAEPGYLLYLRESDKTLEAQRFDSKSYTLSGDARSVQGEVQYLAQTDLALFDVAGRQTLVAQTGKGAANSQLTWFDRNGRATGVVGRAGSIGNPGLSPNGRRIAFDQTDSEGRTIGVWVYDVSTDAISRLTLDPSLNQSPVWSPDGKQVAFSSNRKTFTRVFRKNADGSGAEEQLADLGGSQEMCWDWSRDGKNLLMRKDNELWVASAGAGQPKPYLQGTWSVRNGQFSPDGKWVVYSSNESGNWEVYVSPFPNASSKWQVSRGGGEEPRWRSDGKELFYLSAEKKLIAVEVNTSSSFEMRQSVVLFQLRSRQRISSQDVFSYSVSGDGQRFLVNTIMDEPNAAPLSIMLNWTQELKEK